MSLSFGVCLYSVHAELRKDYFHALEKIAEIGYRNVELLAGFEMSNRFGASIPVNELRNKFNELNLNIVSAHETIPMGLDLLAQDWDWIINYNVELGCRRIVLPAVMAQTEEEMRATAGQLNELGKKCARYGVQLYLHTHALEFKKIGDHELADLIFDNTDPENLKFEVDMAWAMRAGIDPLDILRKLGSRCDLVHQKDISKHAHPVNILELVTDEDDKLGVFGVYRKYVKPGDFVNLGEGIFDFERVYQGIREMGFVECTLAENEGVDPDRFRSIEIDYNTLKKYV